MKLKRITIKEASYQASDIPKEFTVVLNLDKDKDLQGLESRSLNGVVGISGKGHVKYDKISHMSNAILIMDANEVLKINKLSRVMYDNPDYFLSNDMKALYRVLDFTSKEGILQKINQWIFKYLIDDTSINIVHISIIIGIEILNNKINSTKDLWRSCKSAANIAIAKTEEYDTENNQYYDEKNFYSKNNINALNVIANSTYENFKYATQKAVENHIKEKYDYEAEWIVKKGTLNIPSKSKLILMTKNDTIKKVEKTNIDKIYKIEYVNIEEWKHKQETWHRFTKR